MFFFVLIQRKKNQDKGYASTRPADS